MWTADATFDPNDFVVKLTNAGALWRPNTWAGAFVQPDINEPYMFQIITNNADTLTIWADWATASSGCAGPPASSIGLPIFVFRNRLHVLMPETTPGRVPI